MNIVVRAGQGLLDVSIMACGSAAGLMDIAIANNIAVSDALVPGRVLVVPGGAAWDAVRDAAVLKYLGERGIVIGTAGAGVTGGLVSEGGEWLEGEEGGFFIPEG